MSLLYSGFTKLSIPTNISVQYRLYHSADLNFPLVSSRLAANDLVYIDLDLALVAQCTQFSAQKPVLGLSLGTIEVLGRTAKNTLINSAFSLSCDANVVQAVDSQFIYDMIAICSLLAGCVFCVHVAIIAHFGCSVNQMAKRP